MRLFWLCGVVAVLAACTNVHSAGSNQRGACDACSEDAAVIGLPIGDETLGPNDSKAFAQMAEGVVGDWYGVAAGFEVIAPFAMRFEAGEMSGAGTFAVYCPDSPSCGDLGAQQSEGRSSGSYRLVHVSPGNEGQGELSWEGVLGLVQSLTFRSLLLQQEGRVLSFVIDLPGGVVQVILRRGGWPDGGLTPPAGPPPVSTVSDAGDLEDAASGADPSEAGLPGEGRDPSLFDAGAE